MPTSPPTDRTRLAARIEHTYLKPDGDDALIESLCREACEHHFAVAMVNPAEIERCAPLLRGSEVRIGTVVGFPLGQNTSRAKAFETDDALARGAMDIDLVINVRALIRADLSLLRGELQQLANSCRNAGASSKVILETCLLNDAQKRLACTLAVESGVDYVKTSTGFSTAGATIADVTLMRDAVGGNAKIKAAGGIRDLATARAMVAAGADRLGTSNSVAIVSAIGE